jgi:hypothetical protein
MSLGGEEKGKEKDEDWRMQWRMAVWYKLRKYFPCKAIGILNNHFLH